MLDTVRLKFPISPDLEQLQFWTHKTSTTETHGLKEYFLYNPIINNDGVMLKYTYYPLGYDTIPLLTLECSLPKLIYGNNCQMLLSIARSIESANKKLANVPLRNDTKRFVK